MYWGMKKYNNYRLLSVAYESICHVTAVAITANVICNHNFSLAITKMQ